MKSVSKVEAGLGQGKVTAMNGDHSHSSRHAWLLPQLVLAEVGQSLHSMEIGVHHFQVLKNSKDTA